MLKFKKWNCVLLAAVTAICLSVGILLLAPLPEKVANAATYYISDSSDSGNRPAGTSFIKIEDALNVNASGELLGFKSGYSLDGPFYLKVPVSINGTTVKSIAASAFRGTQIVSLDFAEGSQVSEIGGGGALWGLVHGTSAKTGAFADCSLLQSVNLPESITTIGGTAFYNCDSLTSIEVPAKVSSVGVGAFSFCDSLNTVKFLGNSISRFERGLFYNDIWLRNVDIPTSVKYIGDGCFYNCAKITRLDLSNVTNIGIGADTNREYTPFYGMSRLAEVVLPTTVSTITQKDADNAATSSNWTVRNCKTYTSRTENAATALQMGYLFWGGYNSSENNASASNYNSNGFNYGNAIYNVYYSDGTGSSNYVKIPEIRSDGTEGDGEFIFVKNTGWQTGTLASSRARTNGTLNTQQFKIAFERDMWYMVDYTGTGNRDADRPLQYPTKAQFKAALDEAGMTVKNDYTYDLAPRVFGDHTMHMFNAKISDAVRIIGNEAFAFSSLNVIDMSGATSLTHIGSGYLRSVPSPIIYLPDRQARDNDLSAEDTDKCVRIGLFYSSSEESWISPQMVIAPNYTAYTRIRESSWAHYTSAEELTFLIPIHLHYENATGGTKDDPYDTVLRMYNRDYNYVQLESGKWGYDYSINDLPAQNGYSKSVWYKDNGYTPAQIISNLNELNNSLKEQVTSIELYARTVLKPDGLTDGVEQIEIGYTFNGKSYGMGQFNGSEGLFGAANVANTYKIYEGSVAEILEYRPIIGSSDTKPTEVRNAGVYSIKVSLSKSGSVGYGEWSSPFYITVTVEQQVIDLSENANDVNNRLKYLYFTGSPQGLSDGPINVIDGVPVRNNDGTYKAYNSVANSSGGEISISLESFNSDIYVVNPDLVLNNKGQNPGVYDTTRFGLEIEDNNYTFAELTAEKIAKLSDYGITVTISGYGSIATINKVWYIIGSDNAFIIKDSTADYTVFNDKTKITFGETASVNLPDVSIHRTDSQNVVSFTLQILSDKIVQNVYTTVGTEKENSEKLTDYINSSMPVGSYRLYLYYPEVPAEQSGSTYCSALESLYEFEVEKAKLSNIEEVKAVTDVLNKKPVYQLKYIQNTVQFYDADLQAKVSALQAVDTGAVRTGVWNSETYNACYGKVAVKFNLDRMRSNNYLAPNDPSLYADNSPINPDTYRVYWQITANNYEDSVDITNYEERIAFNYSIVIYDFVTKITQVSSVTYTGSRVVPEVSESDKYHILWQDYTKYEKPYVNAGIHKFELMLNDPDHYRWEGNTVENLTVTFEITAVNNVWRYTPSIYGWTYDGNANASPTAVSQYGTVVYKYYTAAWGIGEEPKFEDYGTGEADRRYQKVEALEAPLSSSKIINAGVYILRVEVETNGDYSGLIYEVPFTVSKLGVAAPVVQAVEYNGYIQSLDKDITDRDYYTVTGNDGWSDVGKYTIKFTIDNNHFWVVDSSETGLDETGRILSRVFEIKRVTNDWAADPSVLGWSWGQYDDTDNAFRGIPVIYGHTNKTAVESVLWSIYSDEARQKLEFSFNYGADGTLSSVARGSLNNLLAGTYYVTARVSGNDNIGDLTRNLVFAVSTVKNTWTHTPNVFNWTYAQFEDGKVITAGEPEVGDYNTVKYAVYTDRNCTNAVAGLEEFALNGNGDVLLQTVKSKLNSLEANAYYLRVTVDAVEGKYSGLTSVIPFSVLEAVNSWLTSPYISPWVNGYWEGIDSDGNLNNTPTAIAKFGNTNIIITDKGGKKYYEAVYHKATASAEAYLEEITNVFRGNETDVASGVYMLIATVEGVPGQYTSITAQQGTVEFEIYASSASIPANFWTELPTIASWTAGDKASTPSGKPMRGNTVRFTYCSTRQTESGAYELDEPLDGVPTEVGHYILVATVYYPGHRDYLEERIMFEIYERVNRWLVTPSIKDWFLSEGASNPVAQDAEGGTITYLYKLADAADETATETIPTANGDYVMIVTAKAQYCKDLVERVSFSIRLATNKWEKLPSIESWSEEFAPNEPTGEAANGEVVYTYWTTDGKQLDAKPTAEGTYIMRATVHAFGYEDLVEEIEFTISPAWDETFLIIDTVLAVVAAIATIVVIAIVIRRKNRC